MTKLHNLKKQTPIRRRLRKSMPKGEIILWMKLKNKQLGYKFRRQFGIDRYVLDFYCPELGLGIEVDGLSHFTGPGKVMYDKIRQDYIESLGITMIRFRSRRVFWDLDNVLKEIKSKCKELANRSL